MPSVDKDLSDTIEDEEVRVQDKIPLSFHLQWPIIQIGNALSGMVDGYKRLFKMAPSDLKAMYLKQAQAMNEKGDTQRCVEFLENVYRIDSKDTAVIYKLGVAYEKNKQPDAALKAYQRVNALKPDHARALYRRAILSIRRQDYENALESLEKAIEIKPDSAELFFRLGQVNDRIKAYDKAIEHFTRAVELNPEFLAAYKNMALTYDSLGNHKGSLNCLKRALEIEERD